MTIFLLVLGLVLFVGLVVLHEFGHFIVARRNGVEVEEFGIGFPPRLWKKRIHSKKGDYNFTINLLPLGGFVKLKGEHDSDKAHGSMGAASLPAKVKIMLAGVALNLVAAVVIFTLVALIGMPVFIDKSNVGEDQFTVARDTKVIQHDVLVGYVEPGSPAEHAGLQTGDRLVSIDGTAAEGSESLPTITKKHAGKGIAITYERNGSEKTVQADLRSETEVAASRETSEPKGYLGVQPSDYIVQRSTWSAPVVAVGLTGQFTRLTLKGLWSAIRGLGSLIAGTFTANTKARQAGQTAASSQLSGPLGIFFILKEGASRGIGFILFIIGIISLTLAIMNVLPIPALDGGRVYMILISRKLFKRPLTQKAEQRIVGSSFLAMILLFVLITFVDVHRFF